MTAMLPARVPYSPTQLGRDYNPSELRAALAALARSIPPTTGRTVRAAATVAVTDEAIYCDATDGPFTVTLLPANQVQFLTVTLIKTDASANAVTLGGTVSGVVNPTLAAQYRSNTVTNDGVRWYLIASV